MGNNGDDEKYREIVKFDRFGKKRGRLIRIKIKERLLLEIM